MSEKNEQDESRRIDPVSMDDFIRFLEAKTPGSVCSCCGVVNWVVIGSPKTDSAYELPSHAIDRGSPAITLTSYALFCRGCGYLRQHLTHVVDQWVAENPAPTVPAVEGGSNGE